MPTNRQTIVAIVVLAALLVPSVFFAKSAPSRTGNDIKQITQQLRRAEAAMAPLAKEGANPSDRALAKGMTTAAAALERANALAERALKRSVPLTAVRASYERALGVSKPLSELDEHSLRVFGKSLSLMPIVRRLNKHVQKGLTIYEKIGALAEAEEQERAQADQERRAREAAARERARLSEEQREARRQVLADPLFSYLSVDIPERLTLHPGAGVASPDRLGGVWLAPTTSLCPQCESTIVLEVVTTTETDQDLAKYPIALNGKDLGQEQINGVTWRHFALGGKSGPFEEYAVIRDGRRYELQLFSTALWSEQDRAQIEGYNPAAARAFADDFTRIARSARILQ